MFFLYVFYVNKIYRNSYSVLDIFYQKKPHLKTLVLFWFSMNRIKLNKNCVELEN